MRMPGMPVLPSTAPAAMIDGLIDDDPMKPCQRRRVPAKGMAGTERVEKGVLHHVLGLVTDVTCCHRAQLSPRLFVDVHHRLSQATLPGIYSSDGFALTIAAMIDDQRGVFRLRRIRRAFTSVSGVMPAALTGRCAA